YKNDDRFISEYWSEYSNPEDDEWVYFPEDGAKIDDDGYITVLGRVDDVINVSGHRLGTMEIESAIVGVKGVAEAAVVGGEHDVKGEAVYAYVITEEGTEENDALKQEIIDEVEDTIGPIARPEAVIFTEDLPKTRSGKIMRRLLEDIASGNELGDTSTLRNPDVVEDIRDRVE
ncbi:MAG: acetyl-coenzyme A synthetase, partial [Halobacteria archaeon]|nr:acetyl-coenzyme A synthetase [Halobacteria archaeon]